VALAQTPWLSLPLSLLLPQELPRLEIATRNTTQAPAPQLWCAAHAQRTWK